MSWKKIVKEKDWNKVYGEDTTSYYRKLSELKEDIRGNPISKLLSMLGQTSTGVLSGDEHQLTQDIEKIRDRMILNFENRIKDAER